MQNRCNITTFFILFLISTLYNCQCGDNNDIPKPTFEFSAQLDKSEITLQDDVETPPIQLTINITATNDIAKKLGYKAFIDLPKGAKDSKRQNTLMFKTPDAQLQTAYAHQPVQQGPNIFLYTPHHGGRHRIKVTISIDDKGDANNILQHEQELFLQVNEPTRFPEDGIGARDSESEYTNTSASSTKTTASTPSSAGSGSDAGESDGTPPVSTPGGSEDGSTAASESEDSFGSVDTNDNFDETEIEKLSQKRIIESERLRQKRIKELKKQLAPALPEKEVKLEQMQQQKKLLEAENKLVELPQQHTASMLAAEQAREQVQRDADTAIVAAAAAQSLSTAEERVKAAEAENAKLKAEVAEAKLTAEKAKQALKDAEETKRQQAGNDLAQREAEKKRVVEEQAKIIAEKEALEQQVGTLKAAERARKAEEEARRQTAEAAQREAAELKEMNERLQAAMGENDNRVAAAAEEVKRLAEVTERAKEEAIQAAQSLSTAEERAKAALAKQLEEATKAAQDNAALTAANADLNKQLVEAKETKEAEALAKEKQAAALEQLKARLQAGEKKLEDENQNSQTRSVENFNIASSRRESIQSIHSNCSSVYEQAFFPSENLVTESAGSFDIDSRRESKVDSADADKLAAEVARKEEIEKLKKSINEYKEAIEISCTKKEKQKNMVKNL